MNGGYRPAASAVNPGLARKNLSQLIVDQLLEKIEAGEFRPGERLPTEQGLMELFSVGRNTVREAVQSLVSRGILEVRPRRGAVVIGATGRELGVALGLAARLEEHAIDDLYEFRRILEVEIAARAAENATAQDLQTMEAALADYEEALAARLPTHAADVAFHRALAVASRNSVYVSMIDFVADALTAARRWTAQLPNAVQLARTQHAEILAAVKAEDAERAREAMKAHLTSARRALARALERRRRAQPSK